MQEYKRLPCNVASFILAKVKKKTIINRTKEHIAGVKHCRLRKFAVFDHVLNLSNHHIKFDIPEIPTKEHRYIPRTICEALKIIKHSNFNTKDDCILPPA